MQKSKRGYMVQGLTAVLIIGGIAIVRMSVPQSQVDDPTLSSTAGMTSIARLAAPDFALPDLNGKTIKLSDFNGNIRIVDFWATWCSPCRKEIPHFQVLHEKYSDQGLTIIGISVDQNTEAVEPFTRHMKMTYTILLGDRNVVQDYGGIQYIPTTFVIDRLGRIYKRYVGYTDYMTFENDIKTLLAE